MEKIKSRPPVNPLRPDQVKVLGLFISALAVLLTPVKGTTQEEKIVWPPPPQPAKISYLENLQTRDDLGKNWLRKVADFITGRRPSLVFHKPYGVTTDLSGRIYVTDTVGWVTVIDREKSKISHLGHRGHGKLHTPIGIAVTDEGTVLVSDSKLKRVYGFDPDGNLILAIGEEGEFDNPAGIAVDPQRKRLFVVDSHLHKIRVYSTEGTFLFDFGERGSGPAQFNFPSNIVIDGSGTVYVCDAMNFRVQVFDYEGNYLSHFGKLGDGIGHFARPKGIALDRDGNIYVVDAAFDNFQIFDLQGRLLLHIGHAGNGPGEFWLPAGIHIDRDDRIYVVDQFNRRIQVFQYLETKGKGEK